MRHILCILPLFLGLPLFALAADPPGRIEYLIVNSILFLTNTVLPLLLTIAFLVFVYNVFRYFIAGADNKDSQVAAKNVALYSVMAFVFIIIFWGVINMLATTTGLDGEAGITPDYLNRTIYPLP